MNRDHDVQAMAEPDSACTVRERYRRCYERMADEDLVRPFEVNKQARNLPLLKLIGDVRGKRVLDVGSAQGLLMDELKTAALTVCMDIAQVYLRVAHLHGHQAVLADGEALPFCAGSFDVVICAAVLEHVLDAEAVVREIERVLAPQGKFIVLVPWEEDLGKYAAFEKVYEFTHLRSFNEERVRTLFKWFRLVRRRGVEPKVERPPHLRLLDAVAPVMSRLVRIPWIDSMESWFERRLPWRLRNRYWRWYWRQLEQFPKWDWVWLWFYPPYHMVFVFEPRWMQDSAERLV